MPLYKVTWYGKHHVAISSGWHPKLNQPTLTVSNPSTPSVFHLMGIIGYLRDATITPAYGAYHGIEMLYFFSFVANKTDYIATDAIREFPSLTLLLPSFSLSY